ncbi:hypothetical protein [Priestia megaterium]|uniref:Uncharacterized protein n=1 Tax=Priestia megaterium TaxID=1404 RepID=A0A6M6E629_PRIMG|nr:hypothetical protein [Priestia megaterium]QJX80038.1 hypothetical protein FDZ14_28450 [Priestia megaterium]
MEGFKIKLKAQDIDFELEIEKLEDKHIDFVRDIIRMIDKKTKSPLEHIANEELKEKYINAARAYKEISDKIQLENEGSQALPENKKNEIDNYVALDVEEELNNENAGNENSEVKSEDKVITKEEMVESHKKYFKGTLSRDNEQLLSNEMNNVTTIKDENSVQDGQHRKLEVEKKETYNNSFSNSNSQLVYSTSQPVDYSKQIKDTGDGITTTYQTYYICTNDRCRNKGKHFIPKGREYITCHNKNCRKKLKVRPATSKGFPHKDTFGNYFVAGKFRQQDSFDFLQQPTVTDNLNNL